MTLQELSQIKDFILENTSVMLGERKQVLFILNREISLRTIDPRKESK